MLDEEHFATPFEIKASTDAAGEFTGYGAVFGNVDQNGDVILPGAFRDTLAERKNRPLPMHLNHGLPELGGRRGVGTWHAVSEDSTGIEVKGRLAGMNTETGRYLFEQVRDGAVSGLSIGFRVAPGGATFGTKSAGGARRSLTKLHLSEVSLVDDPCNTLALIREVKSRFEGKASILLAGDRDKAAASIAAAMKMHDKAMGADWSNMTPKDKAILMDHMQDAHQALTGSRTPDTLEGWTKSAAQLRTELDEVKALLETLQRAHDAPLITADALGFA